MPLPKVVSWLMTMRQLLHFLNKYSFQARKGMKEEGRWQRGLPPLGKASSRLSWRRKWQPTSVLLPGESHGQRSLVGYSPWGRKESDTIERLNNNPNLKTSLMNHWFHGHLQLQNILGNQSLSLLFSLKQKHCHTQPKLKSGGCMWREQWFSKCGPQTSTVSITWEYLENSNSKSSGAATPLEVQWLRLWVPNAGGPGSIYSQGTKSHTKQLKMPQWRVKIPWATAKMQHHQINEQRKINIKSSGAMF